MANVFLVCVLLFHFQRILAGPVFLSGSTAHVVLSRAKRGNSGVFEELWEGNLERECYEEKCDAEEIREVFENSQLAENFWASYAGRGSQCLQDPCQNQGTCKDQGDSYICSCPDGFIGQNCEMALQAFLRRCDFNNGQCMHFCEAGATGITCSCAPGYKLDEDGLGCQPEAEFPCGMTARRAMMRVTRSVGGTIDTPVRHNNATPTMTTTPATASTEAPRGHNGSVENHPPWNQRVIDTLKKKIPMVRKRIIGGHDVRPGDIPWQVALVYSDDGRVFCGGSILSERWVITAAHCLAQAEGPFFVRVGEHQISIPEGHEQDLQVSEQHIYPFYNPQVSLVNHDLALLHLDKAIIYSRTVRPICIGPQDFTEALVQSSSPATVSGWGITQTANTSDALKKIKVPFTNRRDCKLSSADRITRFMFCAGFDDKDEDPCKGDSGGPHANKRHGTWFLTGIVSWGEECAQKGKYGVYTRLSLYYSWIHSMINNLAFSMEEPQEEE
uniref:coagulation factor IXa n=1 Tax=Doryrhamphus excisus TaxID=161450 RepID=UPI0025AE38C5|nr:coagulation factor IXa [Doryrhamphus excisus]